MPFQTPCPISAVVDPGSELARTVESLVPLGILLPAPSARCPVRVCIAMTVRQPGANIRDFVAYHLATGFEHVFVFIDAPEMCDWTAVSNMPHVTALPGSGPHDPPETDPRLGLIRTQVDHEVMARQILNVERALNLARQARYHWLLHLDADELFGCPNIQPHFDSIAPTVGVVHYPNHEGAPAELDSPNVFRDTRLFKLNGRMTAAREIDHWLRHSGRTWHFLAYANGKAAVRVAPGAYSKGVHSFVPSPDHPDVLEFGLAPAVLHFANGSLTEFVRKYRHRGAFSDHYFGRATSPRLEFHRMSRDVVASDDAEAIEAWYRRHVLFDRPEENERMLQAGIARLFDTPSALLPAP